MKMTDYKETKLAIFEKAANGEISDEDKSKLLTMLEAKKDAETLSRDDIDKFFKNLKDMYPDFEKDIDKLVKKLGDGDEDDEEDDKEDDMEDSEEVFQALLEAGYDIYEAIEIVKECDYMFYDNCNDMTDVAYKYIEQTGMLDNVPEFAQRYFDYEQFGRDMDIEGHFYECGNGFIEVLR